MENDTAEAQSVSSKSSTVSRASMAAAKARAKAEAAQARAAFARKEIEIKIEKARLEATLDALEKEGEAEAARAEAAVMEAAVANLEPAEVEPRAHLLPTQSPKQRTEEYVNQHADTSTPEQPHGERDGGSIKEEGHILHTPSQPQASGDELREKSPAPEYRVLSSYPENVTPQIKREHIPTPKTHLQHHLSSQTNVPNYSDHYNDNKPSTARYSSDNAASFDLAKYLARSQLVSSGLTRFDDRPENYLAWKSSFLNTIKGLDLTAGEELDLLIKWLGRESAEHARRIKSVNVRNLSSGLDLIWERLEETYGSPEAIENALFTKIENFPKITAKDHQKLRELGDLLTELEAAKQDGYLPGLSYLDTARGVNPIVEKLPHALQEKWMMKGSHYKREFQVAFPPFSFFAEFVRAEAQARNDPSFNLTSPFMAPNRKDRFESHSNLRRPVSVHKTDISSSSSSLLADRQSKNAEGPDRQCPIHRKPHPLKKCRGFREMPLENRKKILKQHSICYKCCASTKHVARNCEVNIKCSECDSDRHQAALHPGPAPWLTKPSPPPSQHGGEEQDPPDPDVTSKCTEVCGKGFSEKSCSKICLVNVYPTGSRNKSRKMYAILDDQSNRSLARSEFFNTFGIEGTTSPYTLKTCSGVAETTGRRATGFIIESADGKTSLPLPTLIECNMVPNNRDEIPTPAAACNHHHLKAIAHEIPPLDPDAKILLLLGRDILRVHKVRRLFNGPHDAPYAQKLDLGWVIIGDVCLGSAHRPTEVTSMKTFILENGRPSHFSPCENHMKVKEKFSSNQHQLFSHSPGRRHPHSTSGESLGQSVFCQTKNDNKLAPSMEDLSFLSLMENEFFKDSTNSWVAPLPFRNPRRRLPNNREYAMSRFRSLRHTLEKRPEMRSHFTEFMQKILDNHHAELAPPLQEGKECWYLPSFGVYHPQKPGQIRVVFDSSAQFDGVSLNDVLLSGPDLNNSLLGVLMRFRKDPVAVTADIQQMFHCFVVREDCRDFLRFLWHRDNDLGKEVVDFRMRVHVFGNSPSPAVATYGLRRAARDEEREYSDEVRRFVERDFYVDDALKSFPTEEEAVKVLQQAQEMLAVSNLRLHKVASNRAEVMDAFPVEDRAKDIQNLDLSVDDLPDQRSLGVRWNIMTDSFTFHVPEIEKPYTRRGVLSTVNSLFDPLGFLAPVTIQGRLLLRGLSTQASEWDLLLPESMRDEWMKWRDSLQDLRELHVPRTYSTMAPSKALHTELCVFSDASVKAISAVAYLKVTDHDGHTEVGFILGKAKLAPQSELTIPRLELCAAVLAVEMAEVIVEEIDLRLDSIRFYTDSKVVLGYIHNQSKRFYVFVNNRVQRIRQSTQPEQWHYVPTEQNPADHGSRSVPASKLSSTTWLTGPSFLHCPPKQLPDGPAVFELIDPEGDVEVRPEVKALSTIISESYLGSKRLERFSNWEVLVKAVAHLHHIAHCFTHSADVGDCVGWHICSKGASQDALERAENIIFRDMQHDVYSEELKCITAKRDLPSQSSLLKLKPTIDSSGLLRVGGRISQSGFEVKETNPLIIPRGHHVTTLLIRHHHEKVQHQGRHFTEGAVRESGLWIVGGKRCISSVIQKCVTCRKLRGKVEEQQMADLPAERLQIDPPFSYVGLDVFGPWEVTTRRTRGGQANSKRWAVLFTCMCTRAVHIEVIEEMSSSSFINALRRFVAIRGPAKQLRSDRGTNFIGACRELKLDASEQTKVQGYLQDQRCTWIFNPPHSSHMGGAWERMIGVTRRILDSMLLQSGNARLTHEVLTTFMAEITAIINARPLIPVSSDPEYPHILTPSMLLTQKSATFLAPPGEFSKGEMFKYQWKRVQSLADEFWSRWRKEFLSTLQTRQKWQHTRPDMKEGDVVLLKEKQARRNKWPLGVVVKAVPSRDGLIRKAEVKVVQEGVPKVFLRPISELVYLLSSDQAV